LTFICDGVGVCLRSIESISTMAGVAGRTQQPLIVSRVSPIMVVRLVWVLRPPTLEIRNSDHGGIGIVGGLRGSGVVVGSVVRIRPVPVHVGSDG